MGSSDESGGSFVRSVAFWVGGLYVLGWMARTLYFADVGLPHPPLIEVDYVVTGLVFVFFLASPFAILFLPALVVWEHFQRRRGWLSATWSAVRRRPGAESPGFWAHARRTGGALAAAFVLALVTATVILHVQMFLFTRDYAGAVAHWKPAFLRSPTELLGGVLGEFSAVCDQYDPRTRALLVTLAMFVLFSLALRVAHRGERPPGERPWISVAYAIDLGLCLITALTILYQFGTVKMPGFSSNFGGAEPRAVRVVFDGEATGTPASDFQLVHMGDDQAFFRRSGEKSIIAVPRSKIARIEYVAPGK